MTFIEKVNMAKDRIKEFILESLQKYDELPVISFSGGKDSCVLRHLVRSIPEGRKCKCVTSAELFHPQTFSFIQKTKIEGDVIFGFRKPFNKIISENGYPMISKMLAQKIWHVRNTNNPSTYVRAAFGLDGKTFGKIGHKYIHFLDKGFVRYEISHRCCDYIKGEVKHCKSPCFIGTTISESRLRKNSWIKNGCNFFNNEFQKAMSRPLSLWDEQDIWRYIIDNNVEVSPIYGLEMSDDYENGYKLNGYKRSGCSVCMFGLSLENEISKRTKGKVKNRFELLFDTSRSVYERYMHERKYAFWKPLTDMGIHLNVDDNKYERKYKNRLKELKVWYFHAKANINHILDELELRYSKSPKKSLTKQTLFSKSDRDHIVQAYSQKDVYGKI